MSVREAPGSPGSPPRWTSSAKSGVGTALATSSNVWFTLSHGILNEVYFPRLDLACIRDLGLVVTDGGSFFSEEKRDATSHVEQADLRPDGVGRGEVQGELPPPGTNAAEAAAAAVSRIASVGYLRSNLTALNGRTAGNVAIASTAIVGAALPTGLIDGPAVASAHIAKAAVVSVALGETSSSPLGLALEARLKGFEGDACPECGNFTMVRNGTCLKCTTCGGTTGCS